MQIHSCSATDDDQPLVGLCIIVAEYVSTLTTNNNHGR
jgi:hypothetical protein